MKTALILLSLVLVSLAVLDETVLFEAYKAQFNKQYSSPDEEALRFENFKASLDRIQSRNSEVFGLTKFSDMSTEEFKSTLLGYVRPESRADVGVLTSDITAPQTLDWRNQNMVTPVKDQGQCGSCWAFSTVENIESMYCMKNNIDCTTFAPLSPQEIVDCDTTDQGCNGGDPPTAYAFVMQEGGLEDDSDYPYTAADGTCNFQSNLVKVTISNWQYATTNSDEQTMQNNLATWGPLSICVDAEPWQDYTGGVLMASDCSNSLDHCVQLVGYDMTQSTPFWIVRNSWGTSWGENGYIRLQYGQDTCGCADEATSAII
jgi:C1A family cysteine protease